jgi:hypothetical protein
VGQLKEILRFYLKDHSNSARASGPIKVNRLSHIRWYKISGRSLRYRVLIHHGDAREAQVGEAYQRYAAQR